MAAWGFTVDGRKVLLHLMDERRLADLERIVRGAGDVPVVSLAYVEMLAPSERADLYRQVVRGQVRLVLDEVQPPTLTRARIEAMTPGERAAAYALVRGAA